MNWLEDYELEIKRERAAKAAVEAEFQRRIHAFEHWKRMLARHLDSRMAMVGARLGVGVVTEVTATSQYVTCHLEQRCFALIFYATDDTPRSIGVACWDADDEPGGNWGDPRELLPKRILFNSEMVETTVAADLDVLFYWLAAAALDRPRPHVALVADRERAHQRDVALKLQEDVTAASRAAEKAFVWALCGIIFPVGIVGLLLGRRALTQLRTLGGDTRVAKRAVVAAWITTIWYWP